ncbi:MAG: diguanylate cyclase [Phycisphaerae bacterium]
MRILIAEDDPISRRVLHATLTRWGYEVTVACDGQEAWDAYQQDDPPKLAILDWMMPRVDGAEVCRRIRKIGNKDYTYIILLTAKGRKEDIIAGLEAGSDDYIVKPFDSGELQVRLRAASRILTLQSDLLEAQEALRIQATHDSLTGLLNRPAVLDVFHKEISRVARENHPTGVILADIDHFKQINDTFGHRAGDAVLHAVSKRMAESMRDYDSVGRYGGEEFLLVMPGCDAASSQERADTIRKEIEAHPVLVSGQVIPVTISMGISVCVPQGCSDPDALIHAADEAMYQAKQAGRNQVVLAPEESWARPVA